MKANEKTDTESSDDNQSVQRRKKHHDDESADGVIIGKEPLPIFLNGTDLTMNKLLVLLFVAVCCGVVLGQQSQQCLPPRYPPYGCVETLTTVPAAPADINTLLHLISLINKIENGDKNNLASTEGIITRLIDALIMVITRNKGTSNGRDLLNVDLGGNELLSIWLL
ncbi:unnamed protein product [Parnassius apollo]|uniref:(apollo) hypothetical protein n=1 Tax=Parnassius apollo TaxID=110799 RepID=A0A8S3WJR0_PARAO|nr:unnamed protein product [Parnassius apollo]